MATMDTKALFKIGYGLYVMTALDGGKDNGCIINTAMQVTSTPTALAVALNKSNFTHDMVINSRAFNLSFLTEDTPFGIFKHFGFQSGRDVDKFVGYSDLNRSDNGIFYLPEYTNAYISCKVTSTLDLGTHTMFISEMTGAEVLSEAASLTYAYYHANIKPKPEKTNVKGYRCRICGYIYEGEPLPDDFICPICKHGAADFEKIV